jgi:ABC-type dipeptide/oligopeptide/nickel transport system permease subunit
MLFYAQARNALLTGQWLWWVVPPGLLIAAAVLSCASLGLARDYGDRGLRQRVGEAEPPAGLEALPWPDQHG